MTVISPYFKEAMPPGDLPTLRFMLNASLCARYIFLYYFLTPVLGSQERKYSAMQRKQIRKQAEMVFTHLPLSHNYRIALKR